MINLMEKKLYQMFILGVQNIDDALAKGLGGVIFFTQDIQSKEQFKQLISNIKSKSLVPPFLSIDQEGGRVERTQNIHKGKKYLSAKFAYEKGKDFLVEQAQNIAEELCDFGINLNFAPCCDVNTNPQNPIIGERAFSDNPEDVIIGARIVAEGFRKNNIIPCIKHFPGHGDANADSHLTLPEINLSMEEMENIHIKPFKVAINDGIEMIMIAHLYCKCFDSEAKIPTSLSKNAIEYLRNNLKFNGVIISDDMMMKGVSDIENACEKAIRAGVNLFIFRDSDNETLNLIKQLAFKAQSDVELQVKIEDSYNKIIELKKKFGLVS